MYIGIAGNIGSGKTTLTKLLTENFGWDAHYESVANNPYLSDFYADMQRWAFNIQVYFLTQRFQSIQRIIWQKNIVVQDRTIYEDAYIFAENLYIMGLIQKRDYDAYMELFNIMNAFITPPDLLIYLKASVPTLIKQIAIRNRSFESNINTDYLTQLNELYENWISSYSGEMLVIDVNDIDFANNNTDTNNILEIIGRAVDDIKSQKK